MRPDKDGVLTSFAVPCPCSVCKGKESQNLLYDAPLSAWICPVSGEEVAHISKQSQDKEDKKNG